MFDDDVSAVYEDLRVAIYLSEPALRFQQRFVERHGNPLLETFFTFSNKDSLNARSWIADKEEIFSSLYWIFRDHQTKQRYNSLKVDLYVLLSKLTERNLQFKFIEVWKSFINIQGCLNEANDKLSLVVSIHPFETRRGTLI